MTPGLELTSAPAAEPITTADAKAHLRVDASDENDLIDALVTTARRFVENYTGRALINQTWAQWMDCFPGSDSRSSPWWSGVKEGPISLLNGAQAREIKLFRAPLSSVTSLSTFDIDDTETTFSSSNYIVDTTSEIPRIVLRTGASWPVALRAAKAVKIVFVAGYGAAGSAVPKDIITAMKQLVAHWFENREAASENPMTEIPLGPKLLLAPYKQVIL